MTVGVTMLAVGFIGLGNQGLPMATVIAGTGYPLHVWARRAASLDALGDTSHVRHGDTKDLAAACDIVGLCVSTDDDVLRLATGGLLDGLRPGSVLVNQGTGTPGNAVRLSETAAPFGVDVLDATVTGGRPAAQARALTTLVGGPEPAVRRCEPVFASFSAHVVYLGGAGSGQAAKLFNNALLMMNQASIGDIVELAASYGTDPVRLVEALKLGSANSTALGHLNGDMVNLATVDHLVPVEELDMQIFQTAMTEGGINADAVTARGLAGARGLHALLRRLNL
jgi:3-hydroxyisobutyrate dehydrogenase-like beta-hydroxyacid dehydrogenase